MDKKNSRSTPELAQEAFLAASHDVIRVAELTGTPIIVWEDGAVKRLDVGEARRRLEAAEEKARNTVLEPQAVYRINGKKPTPKH